MIDKIKDLLEWFFEKYIKPNKKDILITIDMDDLKHFYREFKRIVKGNLHDDPKKQIQDLIDKYRYKAEVYRRPDPHKLYMEILRDLTDLRRC